MKKIKEFGSLILELLDAISPVIATIFCILAAIGDRYEEAIFFLMLSIILGFTSGQVKIRYNGTTEVVSIQK